MLTLLPVFLPARVRAFFLLATHLTHQLTQPAVARRLVQTTYGAASFSVTQRENARWSSPRPRGRGTEPAKGSVVPYFSLHQFPERRPPRAEVGHLLCQKPRSAGLTLAPVTSQRGLSPASFSRPFAPIPPFSFKICELCKLR